MKTWVCMYITVCFLALRPIESETTILPKTRAETLTTNPQRKNCRNSELDKATPDIVLHELKYHVEKTALLQSDPLCCPIVVMDVLLFRLVAGKSCGSNHLLGTTTKLIAAILVDQLFRCEMKVAFPHLFCPTFQRTKK